jgi:AcrR family transcriptional regulator
MSVTKAVIYYNFDSKEEVLSSIVDRTLSYTHESIDRGIAAGSTLAQKLALACFFYAAHILTHQKMIAVYFREERNFPVALRRRTSLLEKSVDEKIAAVLGAGVISREFEPLDSRLMAITIMGMMSMNFYWYRARGRLSAQGLCRQFAEQALRLTGFTGNLDLDDAVWRLPT